MLSGRGLCDKLITRPEESYRLWCIVCDLETSRIGVPYIYDVSSLRVKGPGRISGRTFCSLKMRTIFCPKTSGIDYLLTQHLILPEEQNYGNLSIILQKYLSVF